MDQLVIKDPGEILEPQECLERMARQGILGSQDLKVTQALAEPRVLLDSLGPKDQLVEWAYRERLEKKVCLESLAHRVSLAYLGRKEQKERRGRLAFLALESRAGPGTRESKGSRVFREVLERRERKAALAFRGYPALQAPKDCQGLSAIQEALDCPEKKVTKASQDQMEFLASKEKQVFLGSLAPQAQPAKKGSPAVMESQGQWERRVNQGCPEEDSQGFQGPKERKAQRVMWDSRDRPGVQAFPDPKESQDSWAPRGRKDSQACLEPQATLWRDPRETEARRVNPAYQGFRDLWDLQGSLGLMDSKVTKETQGGRGLPELQGPRESQDSRACLGLEALQASLARRGIWDLLEFQDFKVRKVSLACREPRAIKVTRASLEVKAFLVPRVPQGPMTSSKATQGFLVRRVLQV